MKVELIFDPECPNVSSARENLRHAFELLNLAPHWHEWNQRTAEAPDYVHKFGSPTILVNGEDLVSSACQVSSSSCRLYENGSGGIQRFPSVGSIIDGMKKVIE